MLDAAGIELDRRISLILNGEAKRRPPSYSTNDRTARALVRHIADMDVEAVFEESGGLFYCVLRHAGERVASGCGETKPLALARAVVHCNSWGSWGHFSKAPVNRIRRPPNGGSGRASVKRSEPCVDCGSEFIANKKPGRIHSCNRCVWRRLSAERLVLRA